MAVLTAYFDPRDPPPPLPPPIFGGPHIVFTNHNIRAPGWIVKNIDLKDLNSPYSARLMGKLAKSLGHKIFPDARWFVWHDYNHRCVIDPSVIASILDNKGVRLGLFKHSLRDCAYTEAEVVRGVRELPQNIDKTIQYLRANKFPDRAGLFELTAFYRKNDLQVNTLFESLYEMCHRFTSRDQVLFPYLLSESGIKDIELLEGTAQRHSGGGNRYFDQHRNPFVSSRNSWA